MAAVRSAGPQHDDPRGIGRFIRDPVHNYVTMPTAMNALVNHPLVQRLRRIVQTSLSSTVYPSMTGTRFEHSLGSMHLAKEAWRFAWANSSRHQAAFEDDVYKSLLSARRSDEGLDDHTEAWMRDRETFHDEFFDNVSLGLQAVALLHDIGHTPFSHSLEDYYRRYLGEILDGGAPAEIARIEQAIQTRPFHEVVGVGLLDLIEPRYVASLPWWLVKKVARTVGSDGWAGCLHSIVAGEVDMDRLDYLMRDCQRSGTEFGAVDHARLLQSIEIHPDRADGAVGWRAGFGIRALSALESFLTQRLDYYRWVIFQPHPVAANRMLTLALDRMSQLDLPSVPEGRWLSRLNYFLPDQPLADVDLYRLAETDDSTVLEALKRTREQIEHRRATSKREPNRIEAEFLSLVTATLHRRANWAAVWKTESDYAGIALRVVPEIVSQLHDSLRELRARHGRSSASARRQIKVHILEVEEGLAALNGAATGTTGEAVAALNFVIHYLIGPRRTAGVRLSKEIILAKALSEEQEESLLPEGFWVVAYCDLEVVSDGTLGAAVYNGDVRARVSEVSATVEGLRFIDNRRPRFYVYYVSSESKEMRAGRSSLFGSVLQQEFERTFPVVVAKRLFINGS